MASNYRKYPAPYIAAGFYEDAKQLLKQFAAQKSLKFSCFAHVWRDFRFSSVFMGRETPRELFEFIEECYRNTLRFIEESDRFMKVGTVYLLYSLYLKQPAYLLIRPVQILLSIRQLQEIYQLEYHFMEERIVDALQFSFIIAKLFKMEAVRISCFPIPMGPAVPMSLLRQAPLRNSCFKEALGSLRMLNDQVFKDIRETAKEFETVRKKIPNHVCVYETERLNELNDVEEYILQLEKCYNAGIMLSQEDNNIKQKAETVDLIQSNVMPIGQHSQKSEEVKPLDVGVRRALLKAQQSEEVKPLDVGVRRALLKAQQFGSIAEIGLFRKACQITDISSEESPPSTPVKREHEKPKIKRRRRRKGRRQRKQKLNVADQEIDCEDVNDENLEKPPNSSAPTKKIRKPMPARRHYFEDEDF